MKTITHIRKNILTIYQIIGWMIICITATFFYASCTNNEKKENQKLEGIQKGSSADKKFAPPVTVLIQNPKIINLDTCPPPQVITIPQKSGGSYIQQTESVSKIIKLLPPETKPATKPGSNFTNFNTEQGLALSGIACGFKDKSGNLWFGTYGGGISRYNGKTFTNFTTKQGLAYNSVWSILEDKNGNLWFGTDGGGVSRYDGKTFTNFTTQQGLAHNNIRSITEDKNGNLWFGTYGGGVSRYNGKTFTNFTTQQGLAHNSVLSITEDKSGNLWFGTDGGGVSRYDPSASLRTSSESFTNFTTQQGLVHNSVSSITEDKSGNLWFGTDGGGVSRYERKTFTDFTVQQGLAHNTVSSITEDKSGNLWFGTYGGGVSRYNPSASLKTGSESFTNFTTQQGLARNTVSSITEDKSGNLWFGTYEGGVSRYDGKSFTDFTVQQGLARNTVLSITEDKSGNLWFGTYEGGVSHYDGKSFTYFTVQQGLARNTVLSITEDKSGNLWFGTNGGGVSRYDGKTFTTFTTLQGLAHNTVLSITEDKSGNLWFGTDGGGVSRYDGKSFTNFTTLQGLANNVVWSITEDKSGNLWLGTDGGGVSRYNGKSFTNFTTLQGLAHNTVLSIIEDKSGNLWFGTDGGGVSRYDGKTFNNFTTQQGLADGVVYDIVEDEQGIIWIGTNLGFSGLKFQTPELEFEKQEIKGAGELNIKNEELKNYTPVWEIYNNKTGYPVKDLNTNAMCVSKVGLPYGDKGLGIIWGGCGDDKVIRFDSKSVNKNTEPPTPFINSVKINEENICWYHLLPSDSTTNSQQEIIIFGNLLETEVRDSITKKISDIKFDGITKWHPLPQNLVLPYNYNSITLDFIAIETGKNFLVRYQYILEGYDKEWRPITEKTTATFGNIYEGTYTFKVKAQFTGLTEKGAEGWSEPILYKFKILPPWWRTWWMFSIYGFLIFTLLFGIYRWRTAAHRKDKEKLELTVIERTRELQKLTINLEDTNKELEAFSFSVSHDLRAPLRAINGYSKILVEDYALKLDNDGIGFLNAIENNSKKMGQLIDDLLAFSKLGRTEMATSKIDMVALVKSVKEEESIGISNEITFTITEILPAMATQSLIKQVWINLISNAIKYSSHNLKPNIEIGSYPKDNLVIYYIKDNGAGFDMQYYDKLFGVFQRLHSQEEFEGTGIGLAIVQKIINRHGGTVWAESKVNEGTCFYFSLPNY